MHVDDDRAARAWMALFGREVALELGRAELVHRAFSKQIRAHPGFRRPKGAVESQQRRPAVSSPNMRMICRSAPLPQSLTMRGGPSNALNWTTMRPFSRTCEIVSMPAELPISLSIPQQEAHARTAPCDVLVPDLVRVHDVERAPEAFRRDVDVSVCAERGRGDPEQVLRLDPVDDDGGDLFVKYHHIVCSLVAMYTGPMS